MLPQKNWKALMFAVIKSVASLMLGAYLMLVGHSLLGIVVPLRLEEAASSTLVTGVVMSAYFGGLLVGAILGQKVIIAVGHIRAFAGLAAIMTASVLALPLFFHPVTWFLLRFLAGVCIAGLFSTMESWLNERADNRTRGQVLAFYVMVSYIAMICGQFLINFWDINGLEVFLVGGILMAVCLVPTALSKVSPPSLEAIHPMSPLELYRASPLSVIASATSGVMQGAYWGMGAVFAKRIGFDTFEVSLFMGSMLIGGLVLQYPIGRFSDRYDRRSILLVILLITAAACALGMPISLHSATLPQFSLFIVAGIMGGAVAAIYPTAMAQAFDYLPKEKFVAASSGLLLSYSVGATGGPLMAALLMDSLGVAAFFGFVAAVALLLAAFVMYRIKVREAKPVAEQGSMVAMPLRLSPVVSELVPMPSDRSGSGAEERDVTP
jgi:MFS family permease